MQDAVGAAPFGQHADERARCECVLAILGWQQCNSSALACGRHQNIEAAARKPRLDRYAAGFTAFGCQIPSAPALLVLMKDWELGEVRRRHWNTRRCQQARACDKDASAHADPFHLQVGVGVEALPNADRDIDAFMDQVDPAIGCDALDAELWMGGEETRQRAGNRALKSERAAQSNEPARLGLHTKRGLLGGFGLDDRGARMLEDLLSDLGQTETSRRSIEQPHAKPFLQQGNAPTYARFGQAQCPGGGGEPAMDNDRGKELKIVEVAHQIFGLPSTGLVIFYDRIV